MREPINAVPCAVLDWATQASNSTSPGDKQLTYLPPKPLTFHYFMARYFLESVEH